MATTKYPKLDEYLRKWGLKVVEVPGWQTRSASATTFTPRAVVCHHTAGSASGNAPSLNYIRDNNLSQFVLGRDGTVYLNSGNRQNHAGFGGPLRGVPEDQGNQYAWGIEAENTGRGEAWSAKQLNAYYRLCAALCDLMDKSQAVVFAHKEWAPDRKSDPAGLNMNSFRANVGKALDAGPTVSEPQQVKRTPAGDRWLGLYSPPLQGQDVQNVQNVLLMAGNSSVRAEYDKGIYGPETSRVLGIFKENRGITERGCGPDTWAALRAYLRSRT